MADSNDDLLEDGDLSETNFDELDLAEEDALLADDEDRPIKTYGNSGEKGLEDDDYIEMGVDEDIQFNVEEALENGTASSIRKPIEIGFNSNDNDDSDDNSGGERTRFKSERKITTTTSTRNASAIPETLDAVALRNPVKLNNKPSNRGKAGRGGAQNRKFGRNQPNIHVNPHFRPKLPLGGPPHMWNSGFQGPPHPPFQAPHPPYGGFQPPVQPPHWPDQGYYNIPPGPPQYNQPPMESNYYGPQEGFYPNQQNYPPQPPPLPQPQMGWGDNFYQGPPTNYQPPHFPPGPGLQIGPPRPRPPFNMGHRLPFNQHKPFQGKPPLQNWGPGHVRPQKREQFLAAPKTVPAKQPKFENTNAHRVRSNLQEVKIVDSLPPEAVIEEEDEDMKAYRKKIEEQKKLREKILKEKEEKRLVAAQQKALETAARLGQKVANQGATVIKPLPSPISCEGPPGVAIASPPEKKMVRVRGPDGKTVLKKLTMEEIKKLKKVPLAAKAAPTLDGVPSRVVSVENLSASTTQKLLESMAGKVGPVEKVELDRAKKTAVIRFIRIESAKEFVTKYQRKMVDLSMIGVKFVKQD